MRNSFQFLSSLIYDQRNKMKSPVSYIIILSSLFILTFAADECPPDVLIQPCRCDKNVWPRAVVCSNITDVNILNGMFQKTGDWPIRGFVLEYSNLMYIPAEAVVKKDMWVITIRNSTLTSLFNAAPTVNNKVSNINLFSVKFQRGIRWDLMTNLKKLLDIKIESSEFRKLGKEFSEHISAGLLRLTIDDTKTSALEDNVFARMKQMDRIHFRNCRITTLKRSMFFNPSSLYKFDFRNNQIETLPDDMFHGMPRLYDIQLQGNRIKYFSESIFGGYMYDEIVMIIFLHNNPLICDCSIRWFVNKERYVDVNATCAGPEDKKGLHVRQLNPAWFNYCQRSNTLLDAIE